MINFSSSIRTQGDGKVITITQLKYAVDGISYKLQHSDPAWRLLPQRLRDVDINLELEQLHNSPLPITMSKWKDLQSLKSVIPSDFHAYYDGLVKK